MASGLRAGVYRADISPPEGVHAGCWQLHTALADGSQDRLELSALVLESGERRVALVGLDLCILDAAAFREARARIQHLTGISPAAVLMNLSHNHAGPWLGSWADRVDVEDNALGQYALTLPSRIAGAVYAACRRLEPASVGFARERVAGVSVNRVDRTLPVDDEVWVLRVDAARGRPLALAVAFGCHPVTIAGQTSLWDTDYPGPLRARVRGALDGAECVFLQAVGGDVAPFDFWFGNTSARLHSFAVRDELGEALAAAALKAAAATAPSAELELAATSRMLLLPRRRVAWSAAEIDAALAAHPLTPEDAYPEFWPPDLHTATSAQRFPDHYQHHQLRLYAQLLATADRPVAAELQTLRLGEQALSATPFEPFTALAAHIRAGSPFPDTLVLGFSNGANAYLPAPEEYEKIAGESLDEIIDQDRNRWAYGITTSHLGPEGSAEVVRASIADLEAIR